VEFLISRRMNLQEQHLAGPLDPARPVAVLLNGGAGIVNNGSARSTM